MTIMQDIYTAKILSQDQKKNTINKIKSNSFKPAYKGHSIILTESQTLESAKTHIDINAGNISPNAYIIGAYCSIKDDKISHSAIIKSVADYIHVQYNLPIVMLKMHFNTTIMSEALLNNFKTFYAEYVAYLQSYGLEYVAISNEQSCLTGCTADSATISRMVELNNYLLTLGVKPTIVHGGAQEFISMHDSLKALEHELVCINDYTAMAYDDTNIANDKCLENAKKNTGLCDMIEYSNSKIWVTETGCSIYKNALSSPATIYSGIQDTDNDLQNFYFTNYLNMIKNLPIEGVFLWYDITSANARISIKNIWGE